MDKKGPYILLIFLMLIVVLIIGVQIGKSVEQTNKNNAYLEAIKPTAKPSPTVEAKSGFQDYTHKGCGLSLVLPNSLTKESESSQSASFSEPTGIVFEFSCEKTNDILKFVQDSSPTATSEVTLSAQKVVAKALKKDTLELLYFSLRNPRNAKLISIGLEKGLLPLVQKTIEFRP